MNTTQFYIGGAWVDPHGTATLDVMNPATDAVITTLPCADATDVDRAVQAARQAFDDFSRWPVQERIELLTRINDGLKRRNDEMGTLISQEMGAPLGMACKLQAPSGTQHFSEIIRVLREHAFSATTQQGTLVRQEPIGVCALITPWNWPMNQIATKVAPALAAGCTVVLKPSEVAPLDAIVLADIMQEAGVPDGVFNLIHGRGADIGDTLTGHPAVDMVSFTGSTRAGIAISQSAAPSIKRVSLELGGKSAGIVAADAQPDAVVTDIVDNAMLNSGQSCNALTRVLLPNARYDEFANAIAGAVGRLVVGQPGDGPDLGPVASDAQYDKVQSYIEAGLSEGATLLAGGPGRPKGLTTGCFVRPTLFGDVTPDMTLAQEEIFGPVLVLMRYENLDDALRIANDSPYGLSGFVWSADHEQAVAIADRMRTGMVHINGAGLDSGAPFGGYKQSGNGREWGEYGLHEFLELKSIYGGQGAG